MVSNAGVLFGCREEHSVLLAHVEPSPSPGVLTDVSRLLNNPPTHTHTHTPHNTTSHHPSPCASLLFLSSPPPCLFMAVTNSAQGGWREEWRDGEGGTNGGRNGGMDGGRDGGMDRGERK